MAEASPGLRFADARRTITRALATYTQQTRVNMRGRPRRLMMTAVTCTSSIGMAEQSWPDAEAQPLI